jgi:hypothetical protein
MLEDDGPGFLCSSARSSQAILLVRKMFVGVDKWSLPHPAKDGLSHIGKQFGLGGFKPWKLIPATRRKDSQCSQTTHGKQRGTAAKRFSKHRRLLQDLEKR